MNILNSINNFVTNLKTVITASVLSWVQLGVDIDSEAGNDQSGVSVSMNSVGDRVAIGAYLNDGINAIDLGSVRVYSYQ